MPKGYSKVLGPLIGALLGGGAGELQNQFYPGGSQYPDTGAKPAPTSVRATTIGVNAILGALLGTRKGRSTLLYKNYYEPRVRGAGSTGDALRQKFKNFIMGDRWGAPYGGRFHATGHVGISPFKALMLPAVSSTAAWMVPRLGMNSKEFAAFVSDITQGNPARDWASKFHYSPAEAASDLGADTLTKFVEKNYPDALKFLGVGLGGGLVGSWAGKRLGEGLGGALFDDNPEADYETRRKNEQRRNLAATIGQVLGGTALYAAAPLMLAKLQKG